MKMSGDFICEFDNPVVSVKQGKVRGFFTEGLYHFRGIPYAKAKRFEMPEEADNWEGIRNALSYGPICPPSVPSELYEYDVIQAFRYRPASEDCQTLNIWTKSINDGTKRPVMFWIHGGAYCWGSTIELNSYEAEGLSRGGDVVVVSINHRLNIFGFLDLSDYDERFRYSATVSIADIVAALRWVKENIAAFGGDPDNVTIFGQSGGGMKVQNIMQTPAAQGLYHKAIVQSGALRNDICMSSEQSKAISRAIIRELGLEGKDISPIQEIPYQQLLDTYYKVAPEILDVDPTSAFGPLPNEYYVGKPTDVGFLEGTKDIPMIIGSCIAEFAADMIGKVGESSSEEAKMRLLREKYGDAADDVIRSFKELYPEKDLAVALLYDNDFRPATVDLLNLREKTSSASTYAYQLAYSFKIMGGFPAWHAADLPLIFSSNQYVEAFNEKGALKLADQMSGAWASFAHTGKPKHDSLPEWKEYTEENGLTMIFDNPCAIRELKDSDFLELCIKSTS